MRRPGGLAVIAAACVLAIGGCGASASDQVKQKVQQFATAAAARDYRTICEQVLAPSLVSRLSAAGVSCQQAMGIALGSVQDPTISIGKVLVSGSRATAITLTAAKGQTASLAAIDLVQTSNGWRVSSLGSPLGALK